MSSLRARLLAMAVLAVGAVGLATPPPAAAAASDQLRTNASVTYQLVPSRHVVHVTVRATLTNKKPSTSSSRSCTGQAFDPWYGWYTYSTTCTYRTSYYYYSSSFYVEDDAKALKATADSGSVKVKLAAPKAGWREARFTYSPIYFGKTRTITYSYDLPASGPRGTTERRAGAATAKFCVYGPGSDTGEVRVAMPAGYAIEGNTALKPLTTSGSTWTWTSGRLTSKPWNWSTCFDASNPQAVTSTPVTDAGPIGTIHAWSDDPVWASAASGAAADAAKLEAVLGAGVDGDGITLAEAGAVDAPYNPFDPTAKTLTLSENVTQPAAFDDALADIWFPPTTFAPGWLRTGYVRWAEAKAGIAGASCTKPSGSVSLEPWSASVAGGGGDQANAACWIISQVADAIGLDRMRTTLATIRDGRAPWAADPTARRAATILSWDDWLDIVTAQGLIPAQADVNLAADLLTEYGVATPADGLADRAKALRGYLDLQTSTGGRAPSLILDAIANWDFAAANRAVDAARRAWAGASSVPTILAGATVSDGPVEKAVAAAHSQADLDAAAALADQQVALARRVADSLAAEAAPRDAVAQIGLLGTSLPDDAVAVRAVTEVDAAAANGAADQIMSAISGAHDAGVQRIAVGVSLAAVLLLGGVTWMVLRRRHPRGLRGALGAPMSERAAATLLETAASVAAEAEPVPNEPRRPD